MNKVAVVHIKSRGGVAKVMLNGKDISHRLLGFDIQMNGGDDFPTISLRVDGELEFDGECKVDAEIVRL